MELKCKSNAIPLMVGYGALMAFATVSGLAAFVGEVAGPLVMPVGSQANWLIGVAAITFGIAAFGVVGCAVLEQAIGAPLLWLVGVRVVCGHASN